MSKKYKLLRDLPNLQKGAIFEELLFNKITTLYSCCQYEYTESFMESKLGDWFEKIIEEENKNLTKPPLGLTPKWLFLEQRLIAIKEAIGRYVVANKEIPTEWLSEYVEIQEYLKNTEK